MVNKGCSTSFFVFDFIAQRSIRRPILSAMTCKTVSCSDWKKKKRRLSSFGFRINFSTNLHYDFIFLVNLDLDFYGSANAAPHKSRRPTPRGVLRCLLKMLILTKATTYV
ncbi:hypothetical protein OUZ56_029531 [Daphnia magna]|uniref:Uncharacterized protein n=1 Tax=Daphnia magna TaxID=35525 RepID=A0ABR0B734_9CRUS|nr:hypothetical protein OUZ56_029531 [Daphnia magna]